MSHFTPNAFITAVVATLRDEIPPIAYFPVRREAQLPVSLDRYPERDLGIGYGRSSGYGAKSRRSYTDSSTCAILRLG